MVISVMVIRIQRRMVLDELKRLMGIAVERVVETVGVHRIIVLLVQRVGAPSL